MQILDRDQFWEKCCNFKSVRIDMNTIVIENETYMTFDPPERSEGFMESKIAGVLDNLNLKEIKAA